MNCPICGIGITFIGTWENSMQYRCEKCKKEIAMKPKVEMKTNSAELYFCRCRCGCGVVIASGVECSYCDERHPDRLNPKTVIK